MNIFYGAAIQGETKRGRRTKVHSTIIESIKNEGFNVLFDHTRGKNTDEAVQLLKKQIKNLPSENIERRQMVRRKMIEAIEGDITAAIFEVSTPSLGTGIEIAHTYLRPRMGLKQIPILLLYQKDYWKNKLSTMIQGITKEDLPQVQIVEYFDLHQAKKIIKDFLVSLGSI